jgi:hypothetical protein
MPESPPPIIGPPLFGAAVAGALFGALFGALAARKKDLDAAVEANYTGVQAPT